MNLKFLTYLLALHQTQQFTTAAKHCGVSQSTLSDGIAALEATLGATLVERDKQTLRFTDLGLGVVTRAQVIVTAAQDLQAYVETGNQAMQGSLTVAAIPSIAPFVLAPFVSTAQQQYPKLKLMLRELQTQTIMAQLRGGTLDMGIIALPYDTTGVTVLPLFQEPLLLITSANDPAADLAHASLTSLKPEHLILLQEGHCLRAHTLQSCNFAERSTAAVEASSMATLVHWVQAGFGVALMPNMAIHSPLVQAGVVAGTLFAKPFAPPAPLRTIAIAYRRTHSQQAAIVQLGMLLKQQHLQDRTDRTD